MRLSCELKFWHEQKFLTLMILARALHGLTASVYNVGHTGRYRSSQLYPNLYFFTDSDSNSDSIGYFIFFRYSFHESQVGRMVRKYSPHFHP